MAVIITVRGGRNPEPEEPSCVALSERSGRMRIAEKPPETDNAMFMCRRRCSRLIARLCHRAPERLPGARTRIGDSAAAPGPPALVRGRIESSCSC